jgi:hypothetical protein
MFSQLKLTKRALNILREHDKIISLYPYISTLYVSKEDYQELLKCMPLHRKEGADGIPYKGKTIRAASG